MNIPMKPYEKMNLEIKITIIASISCFLEEENINVGFYYQIINKCLMKSEIN